jgi:hypothetical protein
MHRSIAVAIVVLFTACANAQQPSSAKREEIKQLIHRRRKYFVGTRVW